MENEVKLAVVGVTDFILRGTENAEIKCSDLLVFYRKVKHLFMIYFQSVIFHWEIYV